MALTQARSMQVLDAVHAVTPLPASVAPIRTRLMTANGSATAAGTELASGGGYTAGTGAPSTSWGAAAAGAPSSASASVTVTNMPATTVIGVEEWDSAGTPVRQEWGALSASKTTNAGDTLTISLTSALS
ncbi:MAG: hypothetical protein ACXVW0_07620 [Nocardioides sp.]